MAGISSKAFGKFENKKKYNGYEFNNDFDINLYESFYRSHDSQIGRFLQIDPVSVAEESPYVAMGNNPILHFDLLGDDLEIGPNQQSKDDIESLARKRNRSYIKVDKGKVSLDFGKLSKTEREKILEKDKGLALIADLAGSSKKYLYEASDVVLARNPDGSKKGDIIYSAPNGNVNLSNGGKDSNGEHNALPKAGYDGQVVISLGGTKEEMDPEGQAVQKPRSATVFHELAENYERTDKLNDYYKKVNGVEVGAHQKAIKREESWESRSISPGKYSSFSLPKNLSTQYRQQLRTVIDNYLNSK